jgi:hypothetical protein
VTAVCQPATSCNPSPYSQIGLDGTGVPITSNGIQVTATGTSATVLYVASTASQYLYPQDFTTNQPGTLLKLPYTPNSMVITDDGSTIYLGSSTALMTISTASNAIISTNTNITGPVLSVSPNGTILVVTDPVRQTISLLNSSGAVTATYGGVGTNARWAPDSQTVYITTTTNQLLVHSAFTGWTADTAGETYKDVAVMVPHIGAYFAGGFTDGRSYCPSSTVNTTTTPPTVSNVFYPLADEKVAITDRLAATNDGAHILGATAGTTPATLNDLALTYPVTAAQPNGPGVCSTLKAPATFASTVAPHPLTGINATAITGVLPSTNAAAAFVTYTGASTNPAGQLPFYIPSTGALNFIKLSGTATAPVAGTFSSDNLSFFAGTAGDNLVHIIALTYPSMLPPTATDSRTISPNLPDANGNIVAPNLLVQRPKKSQS